MVPVGVNEVPSNHDWNISPLVKRGDTCIGITYNINELFLIIREHKSGSLIELFAVELCPIGGERGFVNGDHFCFYNFHHRIDDSCIGGGHFDLSRSSDQGLNMIWSDNVVCTDVIILHQRQY